MKYRSLISMQNLELAWRRITTGRNLQYKRIYRPLYYAYEVAHKENLKYLHERLLGNWKPNSPDRIYIPKPSGLQRPLTLLGIEDQIVLQAVSNAFAKKLFEKRKKVENKYVFSNILNKPKNSKFFLRDWHETYYHFQKKCNEYFESGQRWIANYDLAAFYDTISHDLLIKLVSPQKGNLETWKKVKSWLNCWTSKDKRTQITHGIPQGPLASDFLAECMLFPLDEAMMCESISYVRYVDDIRIFAKSRFEVHKAVSRMEIYCRNLGLIPQGKKFKIREAKTPEQISDLLPSLPPFEFEPRDEQDLLLKKEAENKFAKALKGKPIEVTDKSSARFVLYRAPKSEEILRKVLLLLPRHPEHIDAFSFYLSNYIRSKRIERVLINILKNGMPYEYVRSELWQILARIGSKENMAKMIYLAKEDLKNKESSTWLKCGSLSYLISCQKNKLIKSSKRIKYQSPLIQALLVPIIPESEFTKDGIIHNLLACKSFEPGIMLAEQLLTRHQIPKDYKVKIKDLSPQAQNVFRKLGLIQRRTLPNIDNIGEILKNRYKIPYILKWKNVLDKEYVHALQILLYSDAIYDTGRSEWLNYQNSFNDALIRAFISFLDINRLPGVVRLKGTDGKNIKYGNLLNKQNNFSKNYPNIADPLRAVNKRRNKLPGSHPYDEKGGDQNKYLYLREQSNLRIKLQAAYKNLISIVDQNS